MIKEKLKKLYEKDPVFANMVIFLIPIYAILTITGLTTLIHSIIGLLVYIFGYQVAKKVITNIHKKIQNKKMHILINHEDEINKLIKKTDKNQLGISNKAIKQIELRKQVNKKPLSVNNLENYSLRDLKILKEYVEAYAEKKENNIGKRRILEK